MLNGAVDFAESAAHADLFVGDYSFHHVTSFLTFCLARTNEHIGIKINVVCTQNCTSHDCSFIMLDDCFTDVLGHLFHSVFGI